jgi:hypothetical protein
MSFLGKFLAAAVLSFAATGSASAQAPQVEKNVSMKMALMIIEGTLNARKMAIKFPSSRRR